MEVFEAIVSRRSIRKYLDLPVEWDKIGTILDAGKWAPSAGNLQNWKFIVILDPEKRKAIAEACLGQHWMAKAPVHIVIVSEPETAKRHYGVRGERLYSIQNCAAAVMNMMLAAHSLELGTCWIGAFNEDRIKTLCTIPDNVRPQIILTVGYPDETPKIPWKLTVEDVMFFRSYGGQVNKIRDINLTLGYTSHIVKDLIKKGADMLERFMKPLPKKPKK